ncbi:unnamed protein product [Jaminaea pallidilutea]
MPMDATLLPGDGPQTGLLSWLELLRLLQPSVLLVIVLCFALSKPSEHPQRRPPKLLNLSILSIAATYFVSAVLIVVRAVVPDKTWTPQLPQWHNVEYQALLGLVGLGSLSILLAWQQKKHGERRYTASAVWWATASAGPLDVVMLAIYSVSQQRQGGWTDISPWNWAQLAIQVGRILLLWPILVVLASLNNNVPAAEVNAQAMPTEHSSLLQSQRTSYGAAAGPSSGGPQQPNTGSADASKQPQNQGKGGSGTAAAAANASMGLSVSADPPPPTFRVFFQRIVMLFPYLWPSKSLPLQSLAVFCVFLLLIGRLVNIAVPITLGKIVQKLGESGDSSGSLGVWSWIGIYASLRCLQGSGGLLNVAQNFAWLPLQQYSDRSMTLMAFRHLLDLSMKFHAKRKTGEVLRILDRGASVNSFFQYLIFSIGPIFMDITIATVFLSATFGPQVGLLLFAIMFVYTAVSVKMTTWRTGLRRAANNKDSISRAIHTDVLLNWETVKSYNNERYEEERYRLSILEYQKAEWGVNASLNALNLAQNLILSTGTLLMLLVVAYDVTHGLASSSDFVVFISYLSQIYTPLNMLSTLYRVIQTSLVDTDKLIALLNEEKDVRDQPGAKELDVNSGSIEFRDVGFSYDGQVDALKGLSFTIAPRSKVALVGESGAGKSSILRLLYRFYDPTSGSILIDGQDISKITQSSLRKAIGVVPQEAGLLNTSIRTNIGYGRTEPPATDEEIDAAAAAAQILDKIRGFPEGMDTVVGERGVRLSGGEKQRVAIARTFLKAPPILLLDEATSALDSQTERQLQAALQVLMEGKTSVTIAHRLSTIVNSDVILVLSKGAVIEAGSHEELLAQGGKYSEMWRTQVETDKERAANAERAGGKEAAGEANGKAKQVEDSSPPADDKGDGAAAEQATQQPEPGMLGIVAPTSPEDAKAMQQLVARSPPKDAGSAAREQGESKGAEQRAPMPFVVPETTTDEDNKASTEAASAATAAATGVSADEKTEPKADVSPAAMAGEPVEAEVQAPVQAAVEAKESNTSQPKVQPQQTPAAVPSLQRAPSSSSSLASTSSPSRSISRSNSNSGKMRQRLTSLIRRTTSQSGSGITGDDEAAAAAAPARESNGRDNGDKQAETPGAESRQNKQISTTGEGQSNSNGGGGGGGGVGGSKKKNKKKGKK